MNKEQAVNIISRNTILTKHQIVDVLNECLEEAVSDIPVAEREEAKAAILNAFGASMIAA